MPHQPESSSSLEQPATNGPTPRLGYLLKQAHQRFMMLATAAIAPMGIDTREWAVLNCLTEERGYSQGEVAQRLGVDRTTMVALVDDLQRKGLVVREPHPEDRRKNRVELTLEGRNVLKRGRAVHRRCRATLPCRAQPAGYTPVQERTSSGHSLRRIEWRSLKAFSGRVSQFAPGKRHPATPGTPGTALSGHPSDDATLPWSLTVGKAHE
jgi:DNA-binding MarR family transcriptional regulator